MAASHFYADSSWIWIAGQLCIAFLFVYRGLDALRTFENYVRQLSERGVPMARPMAGAGSPPC